MTKDNVKVNEGGLDNRGMEDNSVTTMIIEIERFSERATKIIGSYFKLFQIEKNSNYPLSDKIGNTLDLW